jgi:hypothetical protein
MKGRGRVFTLGGYKIFSHNSRRTRNFSAVSTQFGLAETAAFDRETTHAVTRCHPPYRHCIKVFLQYGSLEK